MKTIKHNAVKRNAVKRNAPSEIPALPWPIPPNGFETEITRWHYQATERRNGGEWVYKIHVVRFAEISGPSRTIVSLYAYRVRENYVTKNQSDRQMVFRGRGLDLEVSWLLKKLPDELLRAFEKFAGQVREQAEEDRVRYQTRGAGALSADNELPW